MILRSHGVGGVAVAAVVAMVDVHQEWLQPLSS